MPLDHCASPGERQVLALALGTANLGGEVRARVVPAVGKRSRRRGGGISALRRGYARV